VPRQVLQNHRGIDAGAQRDVAFVEIVEKRLRRLEGLLKVGNRETDYFCGRVVCGVVQISAGARTRAFG
jgi:hypothetical protein